MFKKVLGVLSLVALLSVGTAFAGAGYSDNASAIGGGLDAGIAMTKHNMDLSIKQLDKSLNLNTEPSRSLDEV